MVLLSEPAFACPLDPAGAPMQSVEGLYSVNFKMVPESVTVGEPFSVLLSVCDRNGKPFDGRLRASAEMPAHKHGMNYRPSVTFEGHGKFRLQGFLFHMPGQWRVILEFEDDRRTDRMLVDHKLN
jgi:hypothetical protein